MQSSDRRTRKQKGRIMQTGKIAVFFPGIGYNNDKPLLYFSRKIALEHGYEVITIFLVNRIGQVIDRFEPDAGTEIVRQAIEKELRR